MPLPFRRLGKNERARLRGAAIREEEEARRTLIEDGFAQFRARHESKRTANIEKMWDATMRDFGPRSDKDDAAEKDKEGDRPKRPEPPPPRRGGRAQSAEAMWDDAMAPFAQISPDDPIVPAARRP